jgi:GlpG protein
MYDYPHAFEILDKIIKVYGIESLVNPKALPPEEGILVNQFLQTPYWHGLYDIAINYLTRPEYEFPFSTPMFEKIQEGEIWRTFTPCLLHGNIFHIFFNMLWVVFLGKLIEERIGPMRYILFIVIAAVVSNTAQYLMSGPNFVGYSGVICGMFAFIWSRQKQAPWESYPVAPFVLTFMFFFILCLAGIEMLAFITKIYTKTEYFPSIANTAHLIGGVTGYFLGRLNLMSMKN